MSDALDEYKENRHGQGMRPSVQLGFSSPRSSGVQGASQVAQDVHAFSVKRSSQKRDTRAGRTLRSTPARSQLKTEAGAHRTPSASLPAAKEQSRPPIQVVPEAHMLTAARWSAEWNDEGRETRELERAEARRRALARKRQADLEVVAEVEKLRTELGLEQIRCAAAQAHLQDVKVSKDELCDLKEELKAHSKKLEEQLAHAREGKKEMEAKLQQAKEEALKAALELRWSQDKLDAAEEKNRDLAASREKLVAEREEARAEAARSREEAARSREEAARSGEEAARSREEALQLRKQIEDQVAAPAKHGRGVPDTCSVKLKEENMDLRMQLKIIEGKLEAAKEKLVDMDGHLKLTQVENGRLCGIEAAWYEEKRQLKNVIQDLKGNVLVFCRVRPPLNGECVSTAAGPVIKIVGREGNKIQLTNEQSEHTFTYDEVFGPEASQADVFAKVAQVAQSALDAYKVCLFSYGQTGTGKTHTMVGEMEPESSKGIIPRTIDLLFHEMRKMERMGAKRFTVTASFIEIYKEKVLDLLEGFSLAYKPNPRKARDTKGAGGEAAGSSWGVGGAARQSNSQAAWLVNGSKSGSQPKSGSQLKGSDASSCQGRNLFGGVASISSGKAGEEEVDTKTIRHSDTNFTVVDDTFEVELKDWGMAMELVNHAAGKRTVGATKANTQSSRSHCVFLIRIKIEEEEDGVTKVKWGGLTLVDLAGSEGAKDLQDGNKLQSEEAKKINLGLLELGNIFRELKDKGRPRYRSSKLTHLLQLCFSTPRSRSLLLLNISPAAASFHQTKSSCEFGENANASCVNLALKAHGGSMLQ